MNREELGGFLRSRRERVRPGEVGLAPGSRRQTPGLRREEVALLAGISVDYYIRLEQGRGPQPSAQVLAALSRTLRLTDDEHDYLLRMGDQAPARAGSSSEVPANALRLLDRLDEYPAMIVNVCWDVLAWNEMVVALIGDLGANPPRERNTLRWLFGDSPSRPHNWIEHARQAVADLRASGRYPDDPDVRQIVDELTSTSRLFRELWAEREVEVQRTMTKRTVHPWVGEIELDCEILSVPGGDHRIILYTAAPGTPSHDALKRLRSWRGRPLRHGGCGIPSGNTDI
ncbi:helix-turn-helix domain-containing protein [Nonomuraea sp. SMC257]|uniref:Helix-turn-helix domain-containing protein n=1 Tax=Nonomuraea montanisoli TaxID=2741721 RepID=A0A7Y6I8Q4_9ACTN|nr:helix-turn-helix transcriptional regulator [Nonomuraea montanisoli]NUW33748.1 helix-turn-helix domain-containing protein [Nonomuraea montanisoli]